MLEHLKRFIRRVLTQLAHIAKVLFLTSTQIVKGRAFRLHMRQIGPVEVGHGEFAEHIVKDRSRLFDAVVALHHARGLEFGEGEGVDELLQRHAVLQAHGNRDGEVVHHRPETRAFLVHVDEDFTQLAVFVFAGAQIDLMPADIRLLGIALAALRHLLAVRFDDLFDDHLFDDLLGQHGGFLMRVAAFQRLGGVVVVFDQRGSQRLAQL